jgi:hypothetical protein
MRKSPAGVSTTDLVLSAHVGGSADVFPEVAKLWIKKGAIVADVTYGQGVFWRRWAGGAECGVKLWDGSLWNARVLGDWWRVIGSDLLTGVDFRNLPYADASIDVVVLDPPFMHSSSVSAYANASVKSFEDRYRNNVSPAKNLLRRYIDGVIDLYLDGIKEAMRVLVSKGILIVKCQDGVCANKQRLVHADLIHGAVSQGFTVEDLFVMMRHNRPGVSRMIKQVHARKNHSYFLVFSKTAKRGQEG